MLLAMGNRIPNELMTLLHRFYLFMAHTGAHNQMRALDGKMSPQLCVIKLRQLFPGPSGAGSVRSLGYCWKSCMAAGISTWMSTELLLLVNDHSTDGFIAHLGKQTKRCQAVNMWTRGRISARSTSRGAASKRGSSAQATFPWTVKKGNF